MKTSSICVICGALLVFLMMASGDAIAKKRANDFPTGARAEYVISCLDSGVVTATTLRECSCVVDAIASHLSYEEFLRARALSTLQQANTPNSKVYQTVALARMFLDKYLRAQASAELKCF